MEELLMYIESHGLPVFIIASCIIAIIGILKLCKIFNKIESADIKKCIYYALDIALSCIFVAIYFAIFNISWSSYVLFSITQIGATTTLYAIYENLGVRKCVRALITYIKKAMANKSSKFAKLIDKLGLDEAIKELQTAVEVEKQKQEQAKAEAESTTKCEEELAQVVQNATTLDNTTK